jgi:iron complex outermembrane recepter protein
LQTVAQWCVGGQQDLFGKPLFNAPKWNFSANGEYDVPVSYHNWKPFVTGSVRWQSQVVFNLLQDPDSVQKAYSLSDLAVGAQDEHFKLTVFCNNVFDKSYALTRGATGCSTSVRLRIRRPMPSIGRRRGTASGTSEFAWGRISEDV